MSGSFTFTLTAQDFAAANWMMVRRHWVRRWGPWLVIGIGLVFGLLLVLAARQNHSDMGLRQTLSIFAKGLMFSMLFVGLQLFVLLFFILKSTRRVFDGLETNAQRMAFSHDAEGLTVTANGKTDRFVWSSFRRVLEDDNFLLLCRTEATFFAVPKRQVDAVTIEVLKRAVARAR